MSAMKRIILLFVTSFLVIGASAQNYTTIKNLLVFNKFEEAKTEFDKSITNEKFAGKGEAYILKTTIYAGLAMAEKNKNTSVGDQLITEAAEAFKKYREMEPEMGLVNDPVYQNGPVNLYSYYYSAGYDDYSNNKWEAGYAMLKNAVMMSDALIKLKLLTSVVDTNVLILAGITAEKSNNKNDAAMYYGRLADNKVSGEGFESIYRFLVSHSFGKKDMAAFENYKKLGKELYPESEFFNFDRVDFAVGLSDNFADKTKALDEVLTTDPNNYKANQIMGELIYDTLNSEKEGWVLPSNADELEKKMISSFNKAAITKPDNELSYIYIGDHFIAKAIRTNEARAAHVTDMKNRTKPGSMSSKEDIAKRDLLDKQYGVDLESAKEPYEKVANIMSARAKANNGLDIRDKEQYKKAVNYLAEIFAYKRIQSKGNAADVAKYTALEKKWNDLYDTINAISTLKKDH